MGDTIDIQIRALFADAGSKQAIAAIQQLTQITKAGATGIQQLGTAAAKSQRDILSLASAQARLQKAQGDTAGAVKTLEGALARANVTTVQTINVQRQLITVTQGGSSIFQQFGSAAASSLTGIVGPAALATAAISGVVAVGQSFKEAFTFKAELDATTRSIEIQLKGVRDSGEAFAQARNYANAYKLTQEEVNEAIVAALPVIRNSKASMEDILGVFDRLRLKQPGKTFEDAARALGELQAGQVVSLEHIFNVSAKDANEMKKQIEGGADAIQVLSAYLERSGIGMDALKAKTEGATGALLDLRKAQEDLKIAQGELAQGPGVNFLAAQTVGVQDLTKMLGGGGGLNDAVKNNTALVLSNAAALQGFSITLANTGSVEAAVAQAARVRGEVYREVTGTQVAATAATDAHTAALLRGADADDRAQAATGAVTGALADELAKKVASQVETDNLSRLQSQLDADSRLAAQGLLGAGDQAVILGNKYGFAASQAQFLIQQQQRLMNAAALSEQRAGERSPGTSGVAEARAEEERTAQMIYRTLVDVPKKASAARTSGAQAAADKLLGIEQKTGDKLQDIVEGAQKRITEITEREAQRQADALRKLNEDIASSAADMRAAQEADDLELFGKMDKDQARRLNNRERAEADARRRQEAATKEAQDMAAHGEATTAGKVLDIRERQIADQQALDEKYYEKQAELAGNPEALAALQTQYEEATRAIDEQSAVRIDIAKKEDEEVKKASADAMVQVIADAETAAQKVVQQAEISASGIKKASSSAREVAVSNLRAIGDAVNAIPSQKTITITTVQNTVGGGAAGGGPKAAGGVTALTHGPATITVGDNPGGVELVSVVPISGRGTTTGFSMAGGGVTLIDAGGGYTTPVAVGSDKPGKGGKGKGGSQSVKDQIEEQKAAVELLRAMIELRGELEAAVNQQPFNVGLIRNLAKRAAEFLEIVKSTLVPTTKKQGEGFSLYVSAAKDAISILKDTADLRHQMQENIGDQPFDLGLIRGLVDRAQRFTAMVRAQLVPTSEVEADAVKRYADAVGSSVGIIKDMAEINQKLFTDYTSPSDAQIAMFAKDADRIARAFSEAAKTYDSKVLEATKAYNEAAGGAFRNVKDGLLAIEALNSGDFVLQAGVLDKFEVASTQILGTTQRLGAIASKIPASDIAALQNVTQAVTGQAEAMIKLAAVPWGDMPGAVAGYARSGGALGGNVYITVNPPGGMDARQIGQEVLRQFNNIAGTRR